MSEGRNFRFFFYVSPQMSLDLYIKLCVQERQFYSLLFIYLFFVFILFSSYFLKAEENLMRCHCSDSTV